MTHPEELLAPYVDGTASAQERAQVDAHVVACAQCRAEVAQASAARAALTRLPAEEAPRGLLPDIPAAGISRGSERAAGPPRWYRWSGAAAAAAVLVLLVAVALPRLGQDASNGSPAGSGDTRAEGRQDPRVSIEIRPVDYKDALTDLLTTEVAALEASPAGPSELSPNSGTAAAQLRLGTPAQASRARACIQEAFEQVPGTLIRLIAARFDGQRAYIGIYAEAAAAGQPPSSLTARVAGTGSCTPLSLGQARL